MLEPEDINGPEKSMEDLVRGQKAKIDSQKAETLRLRSSKKRCVRRFRGANKQVAKMEHELEKVSRAHQESLEQRNKRVQAMEDELTRAKELLAARSTELSVAQSFLSTADRLSEAEVSNIVRNLNRNINQVAASLTEQWKRPGSSPSGKFIISKADIDDFSRSYGPVLVHQSLEGDPAAVNFLVRSCLCMIVAQITLSWRHDDGTELAKLGYVYKRLSASGRSTSPIVGEINSRVQEEQEISAKWRSLTHKHLANPSQTYDSSTTIVQHVAKVLWITGSFQSIRHSFDFVKALASDGIEIIYRLARRLETAFIVDITSSDMSLLFETPRTVFDETWMTKVFESDGYRARRKQDKVAGTTEVGLWKSVGGRRGQGQGTEILSKARVILERDLIGLEEREGALSCIFG